MEKPLFKLNLCVIQRAWLGRGLSLTRGFIVIPYDRLSTQMCAVTVYKLGGYGVLCARGYVNPGFYAWLLIWPFNRVRGLCLKPVVLCYAMCLWVSASRPALSP
jgi:hypothetical protein